MVEVNDTSGKYTAEGVLTSGSTVSEEFVVERGASGAGTTGFDLSLSGMTTSVVALERRIGLNQTEWGVIESFNADTEQRVNQYVKKASYRVRRTTGTDDINYVMAK